MIIYTIGPCCPSDSWLGSYAHGSCRCTIWLGRKCFWLWSFWFGTWALSSRPKYLGFRLIICGAAIYGAWLSFLFLVVLFTSCPFVHMHWYLNQSIVLRIPVIICSNCSIDISNLRGGQRHDKWLPLENIKTGRLHLAVTVLEEDEKVHSF